MRMSRCPLTVYKHSKLIMQRSYVILTHKDKYAQENKQ